MSDGDLNIREKAQLFAKSIGDTQGPICTKDFNALAVELKNSHGEEILFSGVSKDKAGGENMVSIFMDKADGSWTELTTNEIETCMTGAGKESKAFQPKGPGDWM